MLGIAMLTVWRGRGKSARLLTWALIGSSLDVYWQWYSDSGTWLFIPMALKYLGTSFGLMQFLRFAAAFGTGDYHGIRRLLYRVAPLALLVGLCGFTAQFLKLPTGAYSPDQFRFDPVVGPLFKAYLAGDALLKLAMVLAVAVGWATSAAAERQRLLLSVIAFAFYALGTAAHFLWRIFLGKDTESLNYIDAVAATALPIGAALSLLKRQFFDVEFYLDRALAGTVVGGALLFIYYVADHRYGHWAAQWIAARLTSPDTVILVANVQLVLEIIVGLIFFLLFHRLYQLCEPVVAHWFFREREKRLDALRDFEGKIALIRTVERLRTELVELLHERAKILFAHVFTREGDSRYQAIISTSTDMPGAIAARDPAVVAMRKSGAAVVLYDVSSDIPGSLVLPMPVGGKLFGFLACGPTPAQRSYAPDERRALATIARETGATLYALQRHGDL